MLPLTGWPKTRRVRKVKNIPKFFLFAKRAENTLAATPNGAS